MEKLPETTDPVRTFLGRRAVFALTHLVCPLCTTGLVGYLIWLGADAARTPLSPLGLYLWPALLCASAAAALGTGGLFRARRGAGVFLLSGLLLLAFCLIFLFSFVHDAWRDIPDFAVGTLEIYLLFGMSLPTGMASLWWLSSCPIVGEKRLGADMAATIAAYVMLVLFGSCFLRFGAFISLGELPTLLVCVAIALAFFALLFHTLWLAALGHRALKTRFPAYGFCLRVLTVAGLPLLGLRLNAYIPFPGDFQNVWCYLLVAFCALTLLPPTCERRFVRLQYVARWAAFPFPLYFFLVFLPFLPCAALAILALGAGFLMLAPTFLLWTHVHALQESAKAIASRKTKVLLALAGLSLLPLAIVAATERDRAIVRPLVEAIGRPDFTSGHDALPMDEAAARRAAKKLFDCEFGHTIPLISLYREWRLFDGLHPSQEVIDALEARFGLSTGGNPSGDVFGALTRPAGTSRRRWQSTPPSQNKVAAVEVRNAGTRTPTLAFTLEKSPSPNCQFSAPLHLADGVWITGMRLKLPKDGEWKSATRRDCRVATWVYENIVSSSCDPALLTLDSSTEGRLKVFPLDEPREVEIDLLMPTPEWCDVPLVLGDTEVRLPGIPEPPAFEDERKAVAICFVGADATKPLPNADLYVCGGPEIAVTAEPPAEPPYAKEAVNAKRAHQFARGYAYAHRLRIARVDYAGDGWSRRMQPEAPRRPLPLLEPDDPWQLGAQAWQLAEEMGHRKDKSRLFVSPIRQLAERCRVLTSAEALIVVETEQQERALAAKDALARNADLAFDIAQAETPHATNCSAPEFLLVLLFALALPLRRTLRLPRR